MAEKSRQAADDYARFLKECGYRVLPKNMNLNFSVGKVKWRPWADNPLQLATKGTTLGRELFIVEKEHDGRPFDLHTTIEDKMAYCKIRRKPWVFIFVLSAAGAILMRNPALGVLAGCLLVPLLCYQREMSILKEQAKIHES